MKIANALILPIAACGLLACSQGTGAPNDPEAAATETPMPVEPDGGIGDGAGPPDDPSTARESEEPSAFEKTFPVAIRGKWRVTDGNAVTKGECDGYQPDNMGKVLTIREDSFSYFEEGGRFIAVRDREPGRIRALFDTTYADTPTRDELEFRVDPVAKTLTVENFDDGEKSTTTYRRCPS